MYTSRYTHIARRLLSKAIVFALTLVLLCAGAVIYLPSGNVYAASSPRLSVKKCSLDIGIKKTIRLKNAGSKVKWSSSNKKVAVVTKKRGKHGSVITVSARGSGKCTITAASAGRKYKCKITVSKVRIRKLTSSSKEKSSGYKYNKKLGESGGSAFNIAAADFSFDLLNQIVDQNSGGNTNILISPDSVATAMVMVENGARGKTLQEMRQVLSGSISVSDYNKYLAGLNGRLVSSKKMIYQQSNSLWFRKGALKPKKSFLKKNKEYHNAQIYEAPFNSSTVKDINTWVYNNTRNMISRIIDRLGPDSRMVIVNTTAFEGKWTKPFDSPEKSNFTAYDGNVSKVKMLSDTDSLRYIKLNGGTGFAKTYLGDDRNHSISFVGIIPPEGTDINDYAASITGSSWIKAWKKSEIRTLRIKVPQFSYDYSVSLRDPLYKMGMHQAFTPNANFSGISSTGGQLQIDDVLHKTHIELDKNGTKAAAATAVVVKAGSALMDEPPAVYLDRPFLYALVDNKTGIPLFAGILYSVK